MMHRLLEEFPELHEKLIQAEFPDARVLVGRICLAAARKCSLTDAWIGNAILELLHGGTFPRNDQKRIAKIARRLDEAYRDLIENGRYYEAAFRTARAASAVAIAISSETHESLLDAACESVLAFDPAEPRIRVLESLSDSSAGGSAE